MRRLKPILIPLAVLGLLEGGARLMDPRDPRFRSGRDVFLEVGGLDRLEVDAIVEGDPDLFWRMRPSVRGRRWLPPLWRDTRSNSLGLRDHEISVHKPEGEFRVLCLGDSCTYGSGVTMADSYPQALEGVLASDRSRAYEVINAGFPGYTSFQGFQYLKRDGLELAPDIVVVSFGLNENGVWSGYSDVDTHARINPPVLRLLMRSALLRLLARPFVKPTAVEASPKGGAPESSTLGDPEKVLRRMSPELYAEYLTRIVELTREHGAEPVLILHPTRPLEQDPLDVPEEERPESFDLQRFILVSEQMKDLRRTLRKVARETDTPLLDLEVPFADKASLFVDNCHLNRQGCLLQARLLYQLLLERGLLPPKAEGGCP